MNYTRSLGGTLISLGAAAGAFGVAAAAAPAAQADDFTDIVNAVDTTLMAGQSDFSVALTDFGNGDVSDGLTLSFAGLDNYLIGAPDAAFVGSVEALTGVPIIPDFILKISPVADFTAAVTEAQIAISTGETALTLAATDLANGGFAGAAEELAVGSFLTGVGPGELLLIGATESLLGI